MTIACTFFSNGDINFWVPEFKYEVEINWETYAMKTIKVKNWLGEPCRKLYKADKDRKILGIVAGILL